MKWVFLQRYITVLVNMAHNFVPKKPATLVIIPGHLLQVKNVLFTAQQQNLGGHEFTRCRQLVTFMRGWLMTQDAVWYKQKHKTSTVRITYHRGAFVQLLLLWKSNEYYTPWLWVFVAVRIQHPIRMRPSHVAYPLYNILPHFLINGKIFVKKKKILSTKCVLISSINFVWNISHSKKKWARYDKNVYWSSCKVPFILVRL